MLKFIIYILFCNLIFGFKHSDICIQSEINCKIISATKNIKLNCMKAECPGDYKHQCGTTHCAVEKRSCDTYRDINSNLLRSYIMPKMSRRHIRNYQASLDKIKNCPIFKWNERDICVKNSNCFQESELIKKNGTLKTLKKTECKCGQQHRFHCYKQFCVTNESTCDAFGRLLIENINDWRAGLKLFPFHQS